MWAWPHSHFSGKKKESQAESLSSPIHYTAPVATGNIFKRKAAKMNPVPFLSTNPRLFHACCRNTRRFPEEGFPASKRVSDWESLRICQSTLEWTSKSNLYTLNSRTTHPFPSLCRALSASSLLAKTRGFQSGKIILLRKLPPSLL